jgi:hypothetical protein
MRGRWLWLFLVDASNNATQLLFVRLTKAEAI